MDQNVNQKNEALAAAVAAVAAAKKQSEEIARGLTKISDAMARCRAVIAEHGAAEQTVAALRADRVKFLADAALGGGDATALSKNEKDTKAAQSRLAELAQQSEDAKATIAALEQRYAVEQTPLVAMSKEIPRRQAIVLENAIVILLDEYEVRLESAYDQYLEIVSAVQARNTHARAAGMPPVLPEAPLNLDFPAFPSGAWHIRNTMGATGPQDLLEARARLAKRLSSLGVAL